MKRDLFIYLTDCSVPDSAFSSLCVIPGFPIMLNSYRSTISLHLPLLVPCVYMVVWHTIARMLVLSSEIFADSCNSGCLSDLQLTGGYGENGRNF